LRRLHHDKKQRRGYGVAVVAERITDALTASPPSAETEFA
jgi:hypothetical protein